MALSGRLRPTIESTKANKKLAELERHPSPPYNIERPTRVSGTVIFYASTGRLELVNKSQQNTQKVEKKSTSRVRVSRLDNFDCQTRGVDGYVIRKQRGKEQQIKQASNSQQDTYYKIPAELACSPPSYPPLVSKNVQHQNEQKERLLFVGSKERITKNIEQANKGQQQRSQSKTTTTVCNSQRNQIPHRLYSVDESGRVLCCLLYTSPSPRDKRQSRMPSSA